MKVKVWNDNTYDYKEEFREQKIAIPAKGYVVMEADEAHMFRSSFCPIIVDHDGKPDPKGYKIIRLEPIGDAEETMEAKPSLDCIVCKYKAASDTDLKEHLTTHESQSLVDEEAEAALKERKKKMAR